MIAARYSAAKEYRKFADIAHRQSHNINLPRAAEHPERTQAAKKTPRQRRRHVKTR
jgi:hypothetical protein